MYPISGPAPSMGEDPGYELLGEIGYYSCALGRAEPRVPVCVLLSGVPDVTEPSWYSAGWEGGTGDDPGKASISTLQRFFSSS